MASDDKHPRLHARDSQVLYSTAKRMISRTGEYSGHDIAQILALAAAAEEDYNARKELLNR